MWYDTVSIEHRPNCKNIPSELRDRIPVCRDDREELDSRIQELRKRNYEFTRIKLEEEKEKRECPRC